MRNVTECQRRLISLGYLAAGEDDGRFGEKSLNAFNHYRATKGLGPLVQTSMAELNATLFPEEYRPPAPKPKSSFLQDWLLSLAIKQGVSLLKGLPIMAFLSGYKTYILAVLIILSAAAETFVGIDIPGFSMGLGEAFAVGLALISGRAGAKADVAKLQ
jgi:peptidoglycan hydrolase-like protein with peptidoglycan-binding domain